MRRLFLIAVVLVSGASFCAHAQELQRLEQPGPCTVQTQEARWFDATRKRTLPVRLNVPQCPDDLRAPYPLIVYTPGLGGALDTGALWAQHWASHGFVVLQLQHPGSDADTLARAKNRRAAQRKATSAAQFEARLRDLDFVLDELDRIDRTLREPAVQPLSAERDLLLQMTDFARIGVAGHSMGAVTVQKLAGQNATAPSTQTPGPHYEPRVRAFLAFSPAARNAQAAVQFAAIDKPFFSVTGSLDGGKAARAGATPAQRQVPYAGMRGENKYLLNLYGAVHMVFAGDAHRSVTPAQRAREDEQVRITRTLTTAYWMAWLRDDAAARLALRSAADYVGAAGEFRLKSDVDASNASTVQPLP